MGITTQKQATIPIVTIDIHQQQIKTNQKQHRTPPSLKLTSSPQNKPEIIVTTTTDKDCQDELHLNHG